MLLLVLLILWFAIKPKYAVYEVFHEVAPQSRYIERLPIERTMLPLDDRFMEL